MAVDFLPAMQRLVSRMAMISQIPFRTCFYIDQLDKAELNHHAQFDMYLTWIKWSLRFLLTIFVPHRCRLRVRHQIRYYLFCPLPMPVNTGDMIDDTVREPTSEVVFDVRPDPAENTFRLHRLNLEFAGEEKLVGDDD
jgi:hypothetical protein